MKASVYLGSEQVELRDIAEPKPGDDEVLIKVARAGLCGTDLHVYQGHMDQRVQIPLVMGHEMCGEIVYVPKDAGFKVGIAWWLNPRWHVGRVRLAGGGHRHIVRI